MNIPNGAVMRVSICFIVRDSSAVLRLIVRLAGAGHTAPASRTISRRTAEESRTIRFNIPK